MHRARSDHAPEPLRACAEGGFTLVEVLVAVMVLTIGLLGTFAALRTSAHTTLTNRERQAEISLAREVIADAYTLPYTQLNTSALPAALQPIVPGSSTASGALQVTRGPSTYLVTLSACSIDDPSDGLGSHSNPPVSGGTWCAGQSTGTADSAPDEEKRLSVSVQVTSDATGPTVQQTALIFNQGLPAVSCLTVSGVSCPDSSQRVSYSTTPTLTFSVTTGSQAQLLQWFVNGTSPASSQLPSGASDPYAPSAATSTFTWQVPQVAGNYTISVRATDAQGDTGPLSTLQVTVTS